MGHAMNFALGASMEEATIPSLILRIGGHALSAKLAKA
jgi:hypothetical protein